MCFSENKKDARSDARFCLWETHTHRCHFLIVSLFFHRKEKKNQSPLHQCSALLNAPKLLQSRSYSKSVSLWKWLLRLGKLLIEGPVGERTCEDLRLPRGLEQKHITETHYLVMLKPLGYVNAAARDIDYETSGAASWTNTTQIIFRCYNGTGVLCLLKPI